MLHCHRQDWGWDCLGLKNGRELICDSFSHWYANQVSLFSFSTLLFTAAGMARPLHGAWSEWPAEVHVLRRGDECSGSARRRPGPAYQRETISWRIALLSGDRQHHHTRHSGAEPTPPEPSINCITLPFTAVFLFCCISKAKYSVAREVFFFFLFLCNHFSVSPPHYLFIMLSYYRKTLHNSPKQTSTRGVCSFICIYETRTVKLMLYLAMHTYNLGISFLPTMRWAYLYGSVVLIQVR